MENQKIINLLDKIDTDSKHFATKKCYLINDENNANYGVDKDTGANNPDTIKYDTRVLKPNLCDYAEAYILVDGTIRGTGGNNNTRLALKNCAPFTKCNLEINDEHFDTAENLDIVIPMYNADADPRAIQQIEFKYMLGTNSTIYWELGKSKEIILEFYKGTVKVY